MASDKSSEKNQKHAGTIMAVFLLSKSISDHVKFPA